MNYHPENGFSIRYASRKGIFPVVREHQDVALRGLVVGVFRGNYRGSHREIVQIARDGVEL
jgi:hypothetical protein